MAYICVPPPPQRVAMADAVVAVLLDSVADPLNPAAAHRIHYEVACLLLVLLVLFLLDLLSRVLTSSTPLFPNSSGLRKGKGFEEKGRPDSGDG